MIPRTTPELDADAVQNLLNRRALATDRPDLGGMVRRVFPRNLRLTYPMPTVDGAEPEPVLVGLSPVATAMTWAIPAAAVWYFWKWFAKRSPFYVIAVLLFVPMILATAFTFLAVREVSNG